MRSLVRILPSGADYGRLGVWIFCIAWLIGNIALIVGMNGVGGEVPAVCGFAFACALWWGGYKLGGTKSRIGTLIGYLVMSIWMLNLASAIVFFFGHYVRDFFFWASTAMLLLLITAAALSKPALDRTTKS